LPARLPDRIDEFGLEAKQPEFEYLKEPAGARADDDDIRIDQRNAPRTICSAFSVLSRQAAMCMFAGDCNERFHACET
jgi:hypothetical protein